MVPERLHAGNTIYSQWLCRNRKRERRGKWTNRAGEKGEGMKGEFDQNRYKSV